MIDDDVVVIGAPDADLNSCSERSTFPPNQLRLGPGRATEKLSDTSSMHPRSREKQLRIAARGLELRLEKSGDPRD